MSTSEQLAKQAADGVRALIADAERKAAEIIGRAEQEADQIRERAESEAREKLERARRALAELAGDGAPQPPDPPSAEAPDPRPPMPTPEPAADSNGGDDSAARLVAMKMALDGKARDEISSELDSRFGASDRSGLLDDVLARAGR